MLFSACFSVNAVKTCGNAQFTSNYINGCGLFTASVTSGSKTLTNHAVFRDVCFPHWDLSTMKFGAFRFYLVYRDTSMMLASLLDELSGTIAVILCWFY
ncbi:hypothetical protein RB195_022542 [Necator americanus]|uniref:Uncharacterized protein n=1 Tax=Necator americanus TaxID=51031 RepID=A0ABR1EFQ0_NECAM